MGRANDSILKKAGIVGFATFCSRILGLVREQVFAHYFGASVAMDAFNIAFRIPNLFRDLFAEGAMSTALVPTFVQIAEKEGQKIALLKAAQIFRLLLFFSSLITAVGIFISPWVVTLMAAHFKNIPGKWELTVHLTQIMFPFFPLVALAAGFMGVLNALGVFFIPALASAIFNLVSIVSGLILIQFADRLHLRPIEAMAIGVLLGGAAQAFCQIPWLIRRGFSFFKKSLIPWYREKAIRQMLHLMVPGFVGLGATQINVVVNSILATSIGAGAVSWLNYAFRLMQFPIGVFGVSFSSAMLPTISRHVARGEDDSVLSTLQSSLRSVMAINVPATFGLIIIGEALISVLFEHGHFTSLDRIECAKALNGYAIGLSFYSVIKLLVPVFYAYGNTKTPVYSSLLAVGMNIALNILLVDRLGHYGLALGTSLTALTNCTYLLVALRKKLGLLPLIEMARALFLHGTLSALAGGATFYLMHFMATPVLQIICAIVTMVSCLIFLSWAFGVRENLELAAAFGKKAARFFRIR